MIDSQRKESEIRASSGDQPAEPPTEMPVGDDAPLPAELAGISLIDHETSRARKQADVLIEIGRRHYLFHGDEGTAYARAGRAVYPIDSLGYRERLAAAFLQLAGKGCNRNALGDAITTLCAVGKFQGPEHRVWLRTAQVRDTLFIDPGWQDWRLIEVDAQGWRTTDSGPMFRRPGAFKPMAAPSAEADFGLLWHHISVPEDQRVLIAAWLLAAVRPDFPCPILLFSGEQGTGKSTTARMLRRLIDPSASPLRSPPKDVRDLLVGGLNGWVLSLDNLSHLNFELSDALCRICTGGAINERLLYTNTDEVLVQLQRPIIANGIEDLATRPDLVERCIHITLERLSRRASEAALMAAFEADVPHIIAGLLDGLAAALCGHKLITDSLPRMADFAQFAAAGLPILGFTAIEFFDAYNENLDQGLAAGVDTSPVAQAVLVFMATRTKWQGTASALLGHLEAEIDPGLLRHQAWPRTAHGLSGTLRRLAPALGRNGIDVTTSRASRSRIITLCKADVSASPASQRHPAHAPGTFTLTNGDAGDARGAEFPRLHDRAPRNAAEARNDLDGGAT